MSILDNVSCWMGPNPNEVFDDLSNYYALPIVVNFLDVGDDPFHSVLVNWNDHKLYPITSPNERNLIANHR